MRLPSFRAWRVTPPTSPRDDAFGKVAIVGSSNTSPERGFIIRQGEWIAKDTPDDRFAAVPESGLAEVWVVTGQKAFYTDPSGIDLSSAAQIAFMDTPNQIKVSYNYAPADLKNGQLSVSIGGKEQTVTALSLKGKVATLTLAAPLRPEDASQPILVTGQGVPAPLTVYLRGVLTDRAYTSDERRPGGHLHAGPDGLQGLGVRWAKSCPRCSSTTRPLIPRLTAACR